jgi:Tfp pilus assembly protein PilF
MSLLLDALKRAEQEKLARQGEGAGAGAAGELPASPAGLELESVALAAPAATQGADAKREAEREGAKAVFAAKQAETQSGPAKHKAVLAIAGVALLLLLGGGGYVWYELSRSSVLAPPARVAATPKPIVPATPEAAKTDAAAPAVAVPKPENAPPAAPKSKPQPRPAEQFVMNLLKDSASAPGTPPLKLSRTIDAPRIPPEVSQGYDALRRGDLASARRSYESALAADPVNVDAHLGLAAASARAGERANAARHYRRALELDPKNAPALAGLAALADFSRPEGLEAQLRTDISRNPQSAALHYTLGALFASQSRWTEAQVSYFEAHRLDPDNPDIVYNLAVSLDHLGQSRLAADFYARALGAAQQQNAQFDKGQVARRIAELKP